MERIPTINKRALGKEFAPYVSGHAVGAQGPWEELDLGLPRPLETMPYALAVTDEGLVAALQDGRLFKSADRGDSWRLLQADGLTNVVAMAA